MVRCSVLLQFLFLVILGPSSTFAKNTAENSVQESDLLHPSQRHRLHWETQHNPMVQKSERVVLLESVQIPLQAIGTQILPNFRVENNTSLIVRDGDGGQYYRWIFHPDDGKYREQVLEYLRQLHPRVEPKTETYFFGFRTSSRSVMVVDPGSGYHFSIKTSTDNAGGAWSDKPQPVRYAQSSLLATELITRVQADLGAFEYVLPMLEPAIFSLPGIDQAQVVRSLATTEGTLQLPLFSLMSPQVLEQIAKANGLDRSAVYEKIGYLWGRAQAEWVLKTGLALSSAHAQNFLVELRSDFSFTGRMVFHDFADAHLLSDYLNSKMKDRMLEHWRSLNDKSNQVFQRSLSATFLPFHGLEVEAVDHELKIYDGIRAGLKEYMLKQLGPWGLQDWTFSEHLFADRSGLAITVTPKKHIDIELVLELVRRKSGGAPSCRFVHSPL